MGIQRLVLILGVGELVQSLNAEKEEECAIMDSTQVQREETHTPLSLLQLGKLPRAMEAREVQLLQIGLTRRDPSNEEKGSSAEKGKDTSAKEAKAGAKEEKAGAEEEKAGAEEEEAGAEDEKAGAEDEKAGAEKGEAASSEEKGNSAEEEKNSSANEE